MYNPHPADNPPERIVRPHEAEKLTGYCDVHLRRLELRGEFPRRFKLTPGSGTYGAVGWRMSSIQRWIDERARNAGLAITSPSCRRLAITRL